MLKSREPVYQALWVDNADFDEVIISPAMIQDHMPDTVLAALNKVSSTFLFTLPLHLQFKSFPSITTTTRKFNSNLIPKECLYKFVVVFVVRVILPISH